MRIRPFEAIRPVPSKAAEVAAVPYDVVSRAEARALALGHPLSFLHVERSDIDFPDSVDPYSDEVYRRARENLDRLVRDGVMQREPAPRLYLYQQVMSHRVQTGVVCCCHVEEYDAGIIRRHERTRQDKEDDRTRHVLALNANAGPIFLTYRDDEAIDKLVRQDVHHQPIFDFAAPDGVRHTGWIVPRAEPYVEAFARLPASYIADGHHRAASAARAAGERRRANPGHRGTEEYNWFLCVLFPAGQLRILPYNRVVADLNGRTPAAILQELARLGELTPTDRPSPERPGVVCLFLDGRWHRLAFRNDLVDAGNPVESLDVAVLESRILKPLLGIGDIRTDARIDFVGGIRGTAELERRVTRGSAAIAFSMFPTTLDQLLAVSDAGLIMPPKSTWFEPKLRSGLFVHSLDGRLG
jgi:uncharacterized protein (DUF1015 family)